MNQDKMILKSVLKKNIDKQQQKTDFKRQLSFDIDLKNQKKLYQKDDHVISFDNEYCINDDESTSMLGTPKIQNDQNQNLQFIPNYVGDQQHLQDSQESKDSNSDYEQINNQSSKQLKGFQEKIKKESDYNHDKVSTNTSNDYQKRNDPLRQKDYDKISSIIDRKLIKESNQKKSSTIVNINQKNNKVEKPLSISYLDKLQGKNLNYPFLIVPEKSQFAAMWDIFFVVCIVINAIFIPIEIAFHHDMMKNIWIIYMVFSFYIMDMIIQFRTTYVNELNEEVICWKMILSNKFFKKQTIYDIFILFTFFQSMLDNTVVLKIVMAQNSSIYTRRIIITIINSFKILHLVKFKRLERHMQNVALQNTFAIAKQSLFMIIILHWICCIFIQFCDYELKENLILHNDDNTWFPSMYRASMNRGIPINTDNLLIFKKYTNDNNFDKYKSSFYTIFSCFTGSGNIPFHNHETLFGIMIMIFGNVSMSIIFGTYLSILYIFIQNLQQNCQNISFLKVFYYGFEIIVKCK